MAITPIVIALTQPLNSSLYKALINIYKVSDDVPNSGIDPLTPIVLASEMTQSTHSQYIYFKNIDLGGDGKYIIEVIRQDLVNPANTQMLTDPIEHIVSASASSVPSGTIPVTIVGTTKSLPVYDRPF